MLRCRKCAYALDEREEPPERCPNCGTPTRAPAPEPALSVALGKVWRRNLGEPVPGDSTAERANAAAIVAAASAAAAEAARAPAADASGPAAPAASPGASVGTASATDGTATNTAAASGPPASVTAGGPASATDGRATSTAAASGPPASVTAGGPASVTVADARAPGATPAASGTPAARAPAGASVGAPRGPAVTSLPLGVVPGVAPRSPRRGTGFYPAVPDDPPAAPAVFAPPSARPAGVAGRAAVILPPISAPGPGDSSVKGPVPADSSTRAGLANSSTKESARAAPDRGASLAVSPGGPVLTDSSTNGAARASSGDNGPVLTDSSTNGAARAGSGDNGPVLTDSSTTGAAGAGSGDNGPVLADSSTTGASLPVLRDSSANGPARAGSPDRGPILADGSSPRPGLADGSTPARPDTASRRPVPEDSSPADRPAISGAADLPDSPPGAGADAASLSAEDPEAAGAALLAGLSDLLAEQDAAIAASVPGAAPEGAPESPVPGDRSSTKPDTAPRTAARPRFAGLRPTESEDDLPAPVASSRPFTVPRSARRMAVPAATAATHELENSAELDLPQLGVVTNRGSVDTVVASPRAPGSTRPDDVDLDLDDLHGETPSDPPVAAPPVSASSAGASSPARASLRPAPRPRPLQRLVPVPAQTEPPALAYIGLAALALGLAGLFAFYFTRGPGLAAAVDPSQPVASNMSRATWPEGYLAAQAARLDADRVEEYRAALVDAELHGDLLGRAEAALCMHLRYGPDLVRRSAAAVWRKQADPTDPRAGRVAGLVALADGDLDAAHRLLAGDDDPRAHLYRALAAQQQGDALTARREAELALAQRPGDAAAALVAATATLAALRDAPLTALQAVVDQHPDHPLYNQALVRALLERGRLKKARELATQLARVPDASEAFQAQVLALQAEVAAATGEVGTALVWAEDAGKLAPQNLSTQLARVRLLLAVGDLGLAQQELGPLLRGMPDDPAPLALQAELAILAGNESAATRAIDRLATVERARARVAVLRGRVHMMRGRNDEAAAAFTAALAEDPTDVAAAISLAELRTRAGASDPLAAIVRATGLLRTDPRAANRPGLRALTLAHANLLAEAGRKDQAIAVLDAALAVDPDDNAAQLRRGVLAIEQGRVTSGRADLMAVLERTDGYPGLVGPLGRLYLREGDLAGLSHLVQRYGSDPRAPDDIVLMNALKSLALGDREAADNDIDRVLQRNPGSWEAHLAKARVHYERERISDALAEIRLARPKQPDAELELWTGKIAERSGKPQEAIAAYRRARQHDPGLLEAGYLLGRALLAQGLAREAVVELQSVTRAAEVPAGAHLALGLALREREMLPEALQSFQHAVDHDPNPEEALYWAGRTAVEQGRAAEGVPLLGRAVAAASPGAAWLPDAQLWLGRSLHRLGRRGEARSHLGTYLQLAGPRAAARAEVEKLLRER